MLQQHLRVVGWLAILLVLVLPAFAGRSVLWDVSDGAIYALLAVAVAYLWRSGLTTFGHTLFFGIGAYVTTLSSVKLQLGGVTSFGLGGLAGLTVAFLLGLFFVYRGLRGPGFTIFTLALVVMAQLLVKGFEITGGDSGIVGNKLFGLGGFSLQSAIRSYYLAISLLLLVILGLTIALRKGQRILLEATRINEERMQGLGYNTDFILMSVFGVSGGIAAIAGALYASVHGLATPDLIGPTLATEALVWAALGGVRVIWGPAVAAYILWKSQQYFASLDPLLWPLILGCAIVVIANAQYGFIRSAEGVKERWT